MTHPFVARALSTILEVADKKHTKLREKAQEVLEVVTKLTKVKEDVVLLPYADPLPILTDESRRAGTDPLVQKWDYFANLLVAPLVLACESNQLTVVEPAIDCIQKLMAYGYITNRTPNTAAKDKVKDATLLNAVSILFSSAAKLAADSRAGEPVQVRVINAIATAITQPSCGLHGSHLMDSIRVIYGISLMGSNRIIRESAKGSLAHILSSIFLRLEPIRLRVAAAELTSTEDSPVLEDSTESPPQSSPSSSSAPSIKSMELVNRPPSPSNEDDSYKESELTDDSQTEEVSLNETESSEHSEMIKVAGGGDDSSSDISRPSSTSSTVSLDSSRNLPSETSSSSVSPNAGSKFSTIKFTSEEMEVIRDCQLVFKSLCQLSSKELPDTATVTSDLRQSLDINSKILALELIYTILDSSGTYFAVNDSFVHKTIKKHLCMSLSVNAVSSVPQVFSAASLIYRSLLKYFRTYLKTEVGVFFGLFLKVLESSNSLTSQKVAIAGMIQSISEDPQTLVDIFVNYDCDLNTVDLFGRAVNIMAKYVQGQGASSTDPMHEVLKEESLKALVLTVEAMATWCQPLYRAPGSSKHGADEEEISPDDDEVDIGAALRVTPAPFADQIEQQKRKKILMEHGRNLFKVKPRKGIQYFQDHGLCGPTIEDEAAFLRNTPGLDKSKIGEYLGELKYVPVLYAYVDNHFNFSGLVIDVALRQFLSFFRLPGEAQKIDRIMEKFAERFYKDNSGTSEANVFANADSAYVLAFAIIMLATDRHSSHIVNKISLEQWKTNLRGLNDGENFDGTVLDGIFARIDAEELKLSDDAISAMGSDARTSDFMNEQQRRNAFREESGQMIQKAQLLIAATQDNTKSEFVQVTDPMFARAMFEVSWQPILAAFSTIYEKTETMRLLERCIIGFKGAIRLASVFNIANASGTFVATLNGFAGLGGYRDLDQKNLLVLDTILSIVATEGNHLGEQWKPLLATVSLLGRMQLSGSGTSIDDDLGEVKSPPPAADVKDAHDAASAFARNCKLIASQYRGDMVDRIYSSSKYVVARRLGILLTNRYLDSGAILDFVSGLCAVSQDELQLSPPRIFSMQKMVEVAVENMQLRIRIVWSRIWDLLANHFQTAGSHPNKKVAVFAIDSLRQLSMKFLDKDELSNYNFQKAFLHPFEVVSRTKSRFVREYVVECLCMMIAARASNIKSGWKSILSVFAAQASLPKTEKMVTRSFDMLQDIIGGYFPLAAEQFFSDLVNALAAYASAKKLGDISPFAIKSIRVCADKLAQGEVISLDPSNPRPFEGKPGYDLWYPVVHALVRTICNANMDNRGPIVQIFADIDNVGINPTEEQQNWLMATCFKALHGLIHIYSKFYDRISPLLDDILHLLARFIRSENENLATIGATSLETLLQDNSSLFKASSWASVCNFLAQILSECTPHSIFELHISKSALKKRRESRQKSSSSKLQSVPLAPEPVKPAESSPQQSGGFFSNLFGFRQEAQSAPSPIVPEARPPPSTPSPPLPPLISDEKVKQLMGRARIQAMLMRIILERVIKECWSVLGTEHIDVLMAALVEQYTFGARVNASATLHEVLELSDNSQLSELLRPIEFESMMAYLQCLFQMHAETERDIANRRKVAEQHLMRTCYGMIKEYMTGTEQLINSTLRRTMSVQGLKREKPLTKEQTALKINIDAKIPVICQILEEFSKFRDDQFSETLPIFYPLFCDLILSDSVPIRKALRTTMERIGRLRVNIAPAPFELREAPGSLSIIPVDPALASKKQVPDEIVIEESDSNHDTRAPDGDANDIPSQEPIPDDIYEQVTVAADQEELINDSLEPSEASPESPASSTDGITAADSSAAVEEPLATDVILTEEVLEEVVPEAAEFVATSPSQGDDEADFEFEEFVSSPQEHTAADPEVSPDGANGPRESENFDETLPAADEFQKPEETDDSAPLEDAELVRSEADLDSQGTQLDQQEPELEPAQEEPDQQEQLDEADLMEHSPREQVPSLAEPQQESSESQESSTAEAYLDGEAYPADDASELNEEAQVDPGSEHAVSTQASTEEDESTFSNSDSSVLNNTVPGEESPPFDETLEDPILGATISDFEAPLSGVSDAQDVSQADEPQESERSDDIAVPELNEEVQTTEVLDDSKLDDAPVTVISFEEDRETPISVEDDVEHNNESEEHSNPQIEISQLESPETNEISPEGSPQDSDDEHGQNESPREEPSVEDVHDAQDSPDADLEVINVEEELDVL